MRAHPYELAFADPAFEETHFPAMRAEIERVGVDGADPAQFLELRAVAGVLRTVLDDALETAVARFGPLLFQGYHYWLFNQRTIELDVPALRNILGDHPEIGVWELIPPTGAGYLQLPRNLLWARIGPDATPEAVDGLFWTMIGSGDPLVPPFPRIDLLLVLGLVPNRPGFSVVEVSTPLGDDPQGHWGDAKARDDRQLDFANVLPGGELQQLHSLETTGEVLKLVSRAFWQLSRTPA
jgi:hypothetical protein